MVWCVYGRKPDKKFGSKQYFGPPKIKIQRYFGLNKPVPENDDAVWQGTKVPDMEDIGDKPARDNLTYRHGADVPESLPGPGNAAHENNRRETRGGGDIRWRGYCKEKISSKGEEDECQVEGL